MGLYPTPEESARLDIIQLRQLLRTIYDFQDDDDIDSILRLIQQEAWLAKYDPDRHSL